MNVEGRAEQIIVVTGASTGIGRACALHLDQLGFSVYAGVRRDADGAELRGAASSRLTPVRIDVTDGATIDAAREQIEAASNGRAVRGLVNNAGIGVGGPLEFLSLDDLRRQFEVNVIGQVAVTQAFLPMLRQARGRIVNIGSIGGRMATPFLGPYSASKFAMEAITDALRMELRPWGIGVAIVEPGSIATAIWGKAKETSQHVSDELPPEGRRLYGAVVSALQATMAEFEKRAIPPERVAKAVTHALMSKRPKTRYLVGLDAHMQAALAAVVPDRIVDRLIARQMRVPRG